MQRSDVHMSWHTWQHDSRLLFGDTPEVLPSTCQGQQRWCQLHLSQIESLQPSLSLSHLCVTTKS